ncbi:unnamed protein product [Callosobruchus maculatus]|uniref:RNase H type-1 domain-containing protein n=1 Tax=Callosobruchus maculatus TaxID=64391 RepID=A0A653CVL6_CALMS|nr:unnamed protein product [Callosobruchus maculatus]
MSKTRVDHGCAIRNVQQRGTTNSNQNPLFKGGGRIAAPAGSVINSVFIIAFGTCVCSGIARIQLSQDVNAFRDLVHIALISRNCNCSCVVNLAMFCVYSEFNQLETWKQCGLSLAESFYRTGSGRETVQPQKEASNCKEHSLSSIYAINNVFTKDPMVRLIQTAFHNLKNLEKRIILVWTPSHIGIEANERADAAAKLVSSLEPDENISTRLEDAKGYLRIKIIERWQSYYEAFDPKLRIVASQPWSFPTPLRRREQVVITRLRIGHTFITSSFVLIGEDHTLCEACGIHLTVKHILLECPQYEARRSQLSHQAIYLIASVL